MLELQLKNFFESQILKARNLSDGQSIFFQYMPYAFVMSYMIKKRSIQDSSNFDEDSLLIKIKRNAPEEYLKFMEDCFINESSLQNLGSHASSDGYFVQLTISWLEYSDSINWSWSLENILILFDVFENCIAENRNQAFELFTPKQIINLCLTLLPPSQTDNIYDPFCRTGNFLVAASLYCDRKVKISGYVRDLFSFTIFEIKQFFLKIFGEISLGDPVFFNQGDRNFDYIFVNPPFGNRYYGELTTNKDGSYLDRFLSNNSEINFTCHVLDKLSETGRACIIVPIGFLNRKYSYKLRQEIISKNLVSAVVCLPNGIFYNTKVNAALIFLDQQKMNTEIIMYDLGHFGAHNFENEIIVPIHEINKYFINGERNIKSNANDLFKVISPNDIKEHKYDLNFSSYVDETKYFTKLTPSKKLWGECKKIEVELSIVQKNITKLISK